MSDVANLGAARAKRDDAAMSWTPIEMLRDTLRAWEADPTKAPGKAVLLIATEGPDGAVTFNWHAANVTYFEHVALLAAAQHHKLTEWQDE